MKKFLKWFLFVLAFFVLVLLILQVIPPKKVTENNNFLKTDRILLSSNKGGNYLYPENTLLAIKASVDTYKADILEFDLSLTLDKRLILTSYLCLNDFTDCEVYYNSSTKYYISDLKYDEIKKLNIAYKFEKDGEYIYKNVLDNEIDRENKLKSMNINVLTIDDVFELYKDSSNILFILRFNDKGFRCEEAYGVLAQLITEYNMKDRVSIQSIDQNSSFNYHLSSYDDSKRFIITHKLFINIFNKENYNVLDLKNHYVENGYDIIFEPENIIYRAHKKGISVMKSHVNDVQDINDIIEEGYDIISTDRIDLIYTKVLSS